MEEIFREQTMATAESGGERPGFIQECGIAGYQPLIDLLEELPAKHKIVGCLMVGYPKYKFRRMPERQHLKVEFK